MNVRYKKLATVLVACTVMLTMVTLAGCKKESESLVKDVAAEVKDVASEVKGTAEEVIEMILADPDLIVIDSRKKTEFMKGHIEGAVNISLDASDISKFQNKLYRLDKNKTYLTYCPDGCGAPVRIMEELNFKSIYNIEGGYNRWVAEGLPIVE